MENTLSPVLLDLGKELRSLMKRVPDTDDQLELQSYAVRAETIAEQMDNLIEQRQEKRRLLAGGGTGSPRPDGHPLRPRWRSVRSCRTFCSARWNRWC